MNMVLHPIQTLRLLVYLLRDIREIGLERLLWVTGTFERKYGHLRSVRENLCVDNDGKPIPWYTYPAIEFLSQLDFRNHHVFEYGMGHSSLYWAARCQTVTSVDNDPHWHQLIEIRKDKNQTLWLADTEKDYVASITRNDRRFDIIIIDGLYRRACATIALPRLNPGGFIILDNSDWYPDTAKFLRDAGLIQIDFTGLGPINYYTWCTSLFLHRDVRLQPKSGRQPLPGIASLVQTVNPE